MRDNDKNWQLCKLAYTDGSLESVKWLALILMTLDHVNHYLLNMQVPVMYEIGRIAMPLFGFVLAYNLARPDAIIKNSHKRAMKRLFFYGLLATPFYAAINRWWPVNIMFTLLTVTYLIYRIELGGRDHVWKCCIIFFVSGFLVEYLWFATAYCLAAWWYCKSPSLNRGLLWVVATAALFVINQNHWSLLALPILLIASRVDIKIPQLRQVFYIYYPLHLGFILLCREIFLK